MRDYSKKPTVTTAFDEHAVASSPHSERRIASPTPDEIRRFGAMGDGDDGATIDDAPAPEAEWSSVEEYVVPPREPRCDVFVLQDWLTISGRQGSLIPQDESAYLDFSDYQDASLFVEIQGFTADQSIAIETAPAKLEGWFRPMTTVNVTSSTIERRIIRWSTATTPPARWIRWRTGNLFSDWTVTFRVHVVGLRAVRPFVTQPPDWIALGLPAPSREVIRVVRPVHVEEPNRPVDVPDGQELVHYTDESGAGLPTDVRERLERAGVWRARGDNDGR